MNENAQGTESGRRVYRWLVDFRSKTHKNMYVLASHSHFLIDNVYNTPCRREHPDEVLPGWIVGTAGAPRYRLPADVSGSAQHLTDVYGYLLATVSPDGTIQFEFKQVNERMSRSPLAKTTKASSFTAASPRIPRRMFQRAQAAR